MLFTTPTFILVFLPLALAGFFMIGRFSALGAAAWLLGASLVFYSHWMPMDTLLLVGSIAVNFFHRPAPLAAHAGSQALADIGHRF